MCFGRTNQVTYMQSPMPQQSILQDLPNEASESVKKARRERILQGRALRGDRANIFTSSRGLLAAENTGKNLLGA